MTPTEAKKRLDGDSRAKAMAEGLIAKIQEEAIAKIVAAEDRSHPPDGLETDEDDRFGRFWCRTLENRDTEAEAIADAWEIIDRARGVTCEPADENVEALRKDVPW